MSENKSAIKPFKSFVDSKKNIKADVYIIRADQMEEVEQIKNEADIIVLDDRHSSDPNMKVMQSYKINDPEVQKIIVQILLEYNSANPTNPAWKRTLPSLLGEWALHNIAYMGGAFRSRTADVDFNNKDEGKFLWDYLKSI